MSDRSSAAIQIGGKVPRSLLPALVEHLVELGLLDEDAIEADLQPNERGVLSFEDGEAVGGAFFELEDFLQKSEVDFDRQSGPSYSYDGDDVSCRGGVMQITSREELHALRRQLRRLPTMRPDQIAAFVKKHGTAPKLRRFQIVGK